MRILDDDFGIQLVSSNLTQSEETGRFVFDVLRTGSTQDAMKVQWSLGNPQLANGEFGVSANDFINPSTGLPYQQTGSAPISGVIDIAAGQSSGRFTIEAVHDSLPETDERFAVSIKVIEVGGVSWTANSIQTDELSGSLINDDPTPSAFDPLPDQSVHLPLNAVV